MDGYPPDPSYRMNYGEQNNNYMPSYDQQQIDLANRHVASNSNYPPQNAPDSYAAYNMANAQYNANLPPFGPPSFTATPYAPIAPSFQMLPTAWNTSAVIPPNSMGWQQPSFDFGQPPIVQYGQPRLDTNPRHQVQQHSIDVAAQPIEEGELSEGEFQDNFGSKVANSLVDSNNNMSSLHHLPDSNGYQPNAFPGVPGETSYGDSARSAVQPNGRLPGQHFPHRHPDYSSSRYNPSDNYSPYGSPRQTHFDLRDSRPSREGGYNQKSNSPELSHDFRPQSETSRLTMAQTTVVPPNHSLHIGDTKEMALNQPSNRVAENLDDIPDDDRYSPELERSSTPDKRTLAQHAILNLMAAKVQFQDYIKEGVNEPLMHGLFESLGMPQTRPKAVVEEVVSTPEVSANDVSTCHGSQNTKPINTQSDQPELGSPSGKFRSTSASDQLLKLNSSSDNFLNRKSNTNGETTGKNPQVDTEHDIESTESPSNSTVNLTNTSVVVPNGEERKDKIARLLAESQKKKVAGPLPSTDSAVPNTFSQAAAAEQAAKNKVEKDRLLKIKMDNLRKSREARNQKNEAASKATVTPVSAVAKSREITPITPVQSSFQIPPQSIHPQSKEATQLSTDSASSTSTATVLQPSAQLGFNHKVDTSTPVPSLASPTLKAIVASEPAPIIPGLFLSSTTTITSPSANGSRPLPVNSQRKRPVAADFDEPTLPGSYKRPFGQSRVEKPLVIDVSDDESSDGDEGSAMDLDRPESSHGSTGPITDIVSSKATTTTRSQQLDTEARHPIAQPNMPAQLARTSSQSNVKSPPDDLKSKMDQIAELHKKIAEAEAKKKAKASANRSGSQTPLTTEAANAQRNMVNEAIAEKNKASAELERLLEGTDVQIASETQELTDAAVKERDEAVEVKQRSLERRRKRRSEIQLGLPAVDAEVEKNQQRLEGLRAEMAKAEAAIQKSLEDKQRLENEMAKLSDEAEEQLPAEQSQQLDLPVLEVYSDNATPQRVDDPTMEDCVLEASSSDVSASASQSLQNGVSYEKEASPTEVTNPIPPEDIDMYDVVSPREASNETREDSSNPQVTRESSPLTSNKQNGEFAVPNTPRATGIEEDKEVVAQKSDSQQITDEVVRAHSPISVSADQVLEAALQQASAQAEEESLGSHKFDTEIGKTYAPDPNQLEPGSPANAYTSEGEIQDSSSPQTSRHFSPVQVEDAAGEESDAYEPPEATPPAFPSEELTDFNSPPFSPAPPEVACESSTNSALEMSTTNFETNNSIEPLGSSVMVKDREVPMSATAIEGDNHSDSKPATFFTPYESPLKRFSSYRFNQNFSAEVPGGFRSISYSHRIDPMKPFCRFELAGGACNNILCEFQHFKDLNLADDMILLQLGDSETFNNQPEVKDSFVTSLKSVLRHLKAQRIRDFSTIASKIAAFRAKFNAENLVL